MKVYKAKLIRYTSNVTKFAKNAKPGFQNTSIERKQKLTISKGQQRFMQLAHDLWKTIYGADKLTEDCNSDFFLEFFDFLNKFSVTKLDEKHYRINGLFTKEFINDIVQYINNGRKLVSMFEIITETKLLLFKKHYVKIHTFFIPDLYAILLDLFAKTGKKKYARYALILKNNTWLKQVDHPVIKTKVYKSKLQDLKWKLKPFQEEFIQKYPILKDRLQLNGFILAFDQGLGKTFTSLALMHVLNKDLVIILCPKTLMFNWKSEIQKIFKNPPTDEEIFMVGVDKELDSNVKYIISNYERINEISSCLQKLNKRNIGLIVDESQNFRNVKAKRTQALIQLVRMYNPSDILLLSGTPIKSNYAELASYLAVIDPKFDDEALRLWLKVFNIDMSVASDIIRYRLQLISFRKMKNEVLQLPEKRHIEIPVSIPNVDQFTLKTFKLMVKKLVEQKMQEYLSKYDSYYQQFLELLERIRSLLVKHNQTELLTKFDWYVKQVKRFTKRGILSNFEQIKDELYHVEKSVDSFLSSIKAYDLKKKFQALRTTVTRLPYKVYGEVFGNLLHSLRAKLVYEIFYYNIERICKIIDESTKTVIFTYASSVIPKLKQLIESRCKVKVVTVTGETQNRESVIESFKKNPNIKVLIASYQIASVGLTLTEADTMIYADKPYREADLKQAEDRIYRIGQTKPVKIIYLKLKSSEPTLQDRIDQIVKYFGRIVDLVMQKEL